MSSAPGDPTQCTSLPPAQVESVTSSKDGATVLATVHESADLWASNGKRGDSYRTSYRVEYDMRLTSHGWRIADALVLGQ